MPSSKETLAAKRKFFKENPGHPAATADRVKQREKRRKTYVRTEAAKKKKAEMEEDAKEPVVANSEEQDEKKPAARVNHSGSANTNSQANAPATVMNAAAINAPAPVMNAAATNAPAAATNAPAAAINAATINAPAPIMNAAARKAVRAGSNNELGTFNYKQAFAARDNGDSSALGMSGHWLGAVDMRGEEKTYKQELRGIPMYSRHSVAGTDESIHRIPVTECRGYSAPIRRKPYSVNSARQRQLKRCTAIICRNPL